MNTQYNKATYGALSGALSILAGHFLGLDAEVAAALTTVIMAVAVYFIPNKEKSNA